MAFAAILAAGVLCVAIGGGSGGDDPRVAIDWPGSPGPTHIVETADGPRFDVRAADGSRERLTPEVFARRALAERRSRSPLERLFNVDGPIGVLWVFFGLAGQAVFAGRMVVQWLASERRGLSVVPPIFWWMSVVGATMLLSYFLWRRDIVGVLGQSLGFVIYIRNLMLIRRSRLRAPAERAVSLASPELP